MYMSHTTVPLAATSWNGISAWPAAPARDGSDAAKHADRQRLRRDQRAGADEVERRQQPEGERPQPPDEHVVFADRSRQDHANRSDD